MPIWLPCKFISWIMGCHWDVEHSTSSSNILKALNSTFLSLIPKENVDNTLDKFHSIPLCNVSYKVISKVETNYIKPLLEKIISKEKGGYVGRGQVLDIVIATHELIHSMRKWIHLVMMIKRHVQGLSMTLLELLPKHAHILWIM